MDRPTSPAVVLEPPSLDAHSAALSGDFKFAHVQLGNIPPRIGGIKCYGKNYTSRNEIILDLEVSHCRQTISHSNFFIGDFIFEDQMWK